MAANRNLIQLARTREWVDRRPAKDAATDIYMQFSMNIEHSESLSRLALAAHSDFDPAIVQRHLSHSHMPYLVRWGYILSPEEPGEYRTLKTQLVANMIEPEVIDDDISGRIIEPFVYPYIINDLYRAYLKTRRNNSKED